MMIGLLVEYYRRLELDPLQYEGETERQLLTDRLQVLRVVETSRWNDSIHLDLKMQVGKNSRNFSRLSLLQNLVSLVIVDDLGFRKLGLGRHLVPQSIFDYQQHLSAYPFL